MKLRVQNQRILTMRRGRRRNFFRGVLSIAHAGEWVFGIAADFVKLDGFAGAGYLEKI